MVSGYGGSRRVAPRREAGQPAAGIAGFAGNPWFSQTAIVAQAMYGLGLPIRLPAPCIRA